MCRNHVVENEQSNQNFLTTTLLLSANASWNFFANEQMHTYLLHSLKPPFEFSSAATAVCSPKILI